MEQTTASNKRSGGRKRVLKSGIIAFNGRHSTLPCSVRDLSTTGARLSVEGSMNAPDTFDLIIELDGLEAPCAVVWRRGKEIGVRFRAPPRMLPVRRKQVVDSAWTPAAKPSLRKRA